VTYLGHILNYDHSDSPDIPQTQDHAG